MAQAFTRNGHHWSGWPGATCMKCWAPDPDEVALANGWWEPNYDTNDITWLGTKEQKAETEALTECPVKGVLVWNKELKKFVLEAGESSG